MGSMFNDMKLIETKLTSDVLQENKVSVQNIKNELKDKDIRSAYELYALCKSILFTENNSRDEKNAFLMEARGEYLNLKYKGNNVNNVIVLNDNEILLEKYLSEKNFRKSYILKKEFLNRFERNTLNENMIQYLIENKIENIKEFYQNKKETAIDLFKVKLKANNDKDERLMIYEAIDKINNMKDEDFIDNIKSIDNLLA